MITAVCHLMNNGWYSQASNWMTTKRLVTTPHWGIMPLYSLSYSCQKDLDVEEAMRSTMTTYVNSLHMHQNIQRSAQFAMNTQPYGCHVIIPSALAASWTMPGQKLVKTRRQKFVAICATASGPFTSFKIMAMFQQKKWNCFKSIYPRITVQVTRTFLSVQGVATIV